jgi:putative membrane protein
LIHWRKADESGKDIEAIKQLSLGLFRFGVLMATLAISFGAYIWLNSGITGNWLNLKLGFVFLLVCYHVASGILFLNAYRNNRFKSNVFLRVFNESSLFLVVPILYLAVTKNV